MRKQDYRPGPTVSQPSSSNRVSSDPVNARSNLAGRRGNGLGDSVGNYRLGRRIASGGMADVFAATRLGFRSSRPIVVKKMHHGLAKSRRFVSMFIDEARLCLRLEHPNIIKLYDFEATVKGLYLVLERIDGPDLRAVLKACVRRALRMPAKLGVFVVAHILEALDYAHPQGIVHRDISPSNILLSNRGRVVLADFGIARAASKTATREAATLIVGKFGYMSPEQISGQPMDARSDLFSVGVVLAELLMCRRLFRARTEVALVNMVREANLSRLDQLGFHIEPDLGAIVRKALSKDLKMRFQTAAEFRDVLTEWLRTKYLRTGCTELATFIRDLGPF